MGLRERKKLRTAEAIEDAALSLFAGRGFQATTIADIAEAAEIAPRTFFAYFPSKESVLFGDFDPLVQSLAEHLESRGSQSLLDALRTWIVAIVELDGLPDERRLRRRQVIEASDELLAYELRLTARFESVIAIAVASELDADPRDLHPRLVAAAVAAMLVALRPGSNGAEIPSAAETLDRLDDTLAFLRGGLSALRRRRDRTA
jgi:AcrR family transcriptional regulator